MLMIDRDVAATDRVGRERARFVEPNGPEIFVEARRFRWIHRRGTCPKTAEFAIVEPIVSIDTRNF